jgi:uncharacterized protein YndB with AHSA1/START domain
MLGGRETPMNLREELRRWLSRLTVAGMTLGLVAACASAPPTPVTSIEPLAGKWAGTLQQGGGTEFFYLTVNPDQTIVATWGLTWSNGRISIANGQASFQMSPPLREGSITFYAGNGKPTLYIDDLFANFHAVVTKEP